MTHVSDRRLRHRHLPSPHAHPRGARPRTTVGDLAAALTDGPPPLRITAYDGTDLGPRDSDVHVHIASEKGLRYLLTARGDLGMARAYLAGELQVEGMHPGNPYPVLWRLKRAMKTRTPRPDEVARLLRGMRPSLFTAPPPPPEEGPPRWRRTLHGLQSSLGRSSTSISRHYDVSNRFYEMLLGDSMTYTCAVYADRSDTLDDAQRRKYALVAGKLALQPGMRLLDVGCGWGGMVRHAARLGVRALGVTLSREQATWAQARIAAEGLADLAEVRHLDYRQAPREQFDAISSIGLTEHIGTANYRAYFSELYSRLRPGGRLLNHCITRSGGSSSTRPEPFTDRYVFPDGELAPIGTILRTAAASGFEVQHVEDLRIHYAYTLAAWSENLERHWDACVVEVGEGTAKVWGLYLAGSRIGFESNWFQLHQALLTRPAQDGSPAYPLRPDWDPTS
ncbi:MAG: class I SAM-dependent methyltransferase [Dermatophilaceae bacterium]